jgi:predicted dehydrogenase
MTILRTAILGCGGFAHKHARNLAHLPEQFHLVAFSDRNKDRAQTYADAYTEGKAAIYTDHRSLFHEMDLDLVIICLPPYGHTDEVHLAAAQGIHFHIEKPIALTAGHAWSMVAAAEAAGVKSQVGFMFRFGAGITKLRQLVETGEAGQVGLMSCRYFCNALHADWWRRRDRSGGQLVEQVIHMVDLMRFLMGDAATIYSLQRNIFHQHIEDYTVEDTSGTVIGFRNGGIGVIYASNGAIPGKWINDYHVVAQKVTAEFTDANHARLTYTAGPELRTEQVESDQDMYLLEILDLYNAIVYDRPTRIPIREGALSLELALAATQSAEAGQVISLQTPLIV